MKECFPLDGGHVRVLKEALTEHIFNYHGIENESGMSDIQRAIALFNFLNEAYSKITLEKEV